MEAHYRATERHLPYGITAATRHSRTRPDLIPAKRNTFLVILSTLCSEKNVQVSTKISGNVYEETGIPPV